MESFKNVTKCTECDIKNSKRSTGSIYIYRHFFYNLMLKINRLRRKKKDDDDGGGDIVQSHEVANQLHKGKLLMLQVFLFLKCMAYMIM